MDGINEIFDRIETQGIDTKQAFFYGYFFYGNSRSKLERLKQTLEQQQYSFVELRKEDKLFVLHVEKNERHTRETLFKIKQNFIKLEESFGVSYDGFDIGSSDPAKPLISNENFLRFMETHNEEEHFQLGIKLYNLEIYDKAEIVFEECLKKNIKSDIVSYKLGNMLSWQGAVEDGIRYLRQAVKLNQNNIDAWFNLGAICYDNGLFEASIEYYQQADKIQPNDENIIYGIAASQFAMREFDKSLENCIKALKINKQNENAKTLLKMLKSRS
jgi:tetratricopeptide (TPR) repeat protein